MKKKFLKILTLSTLVLMVGGIADFDFINNRNDVQMVQATEAATSPTYTFNNATDFSNDWNIDTINNTEKQSVEISNAKSSIFDGTNHLYFTTAKYNKVNGEIKISSKKSFNNVSGIKFDYMVTDGSNPLVTLKIGNQIILNSIKPRDGMIDNADTILRLDTNEMATSMSNGKGYTITLNSNLFAQRPSGKIEISVTCSNTSLKYIAIDNMYIEQEKTLTDLNIAFENETTELHNGGEAAIKVNGTYDDGSKEESITGATWTVEDSSGNDASNLAKVENNIVNVIANPDIDTVITLKATYEGITSNALQVTIKHFNPTENITLSLDFGIVTPSDTSIKNIEVPKDLEIGEDALPTLTSTTGETFLGWYSNNTLITSKSTFSSATTLTAKWNVMKTDDNAAITTPAVKLGIENCTFTTESQAGFKRISSIDEIKSGARFTLLNQALNYIINTDAGTYYNGGSFNSVVDNQYFLENSPTKHITLQLEDAGLENGQQTYYIKVFNKTETSNDYLAVVGDKQLQNVTTKDNKWTVDVSKDGQLTMIDVTTKQASKNILFRTTDHRFNAYEISENTQLPVGFVYTTEAHKNVVSADFTNSAAMMQYAVYVSKNYYDNLVDNTEFGKINVTLSQGEKSVPVVVKLTKNAELTTKLNTKYESGLYYELSYTISGINNYDVDIAINYEINEYKSETRHYTVKELVNYYLTNNLLDGELKVIVNEYKTNIGA